MYCKYQRLNITWLFFLAFLILIENPGWATRRDNLAAAKATRTFRIVWKQRDSHTTQKLNDVHFYDLNHGWAVGDSSTWCFTRDGGYNWLLDSVSDTSFYTFTAVSMVSDSEGYICGYDAYGYAIIVYLANGIPTIQYLQKSFEFYDIFFINAETGWVVGQGDTLLYTHDGGEIWHRVANLPTDSLFAINFINPDTGWTVGAGGVVLKSTDGGLSWEPQNSQVTKLLYDVHFVNSNNGWAIGRENMGIRTFDGGTTWSPFSLGDDSDYHAVSFCDDSQGWIVGNKGHVYQSIDSGLNWDKETVPIDSTIGLYGLDVKDFKDAWAVGDSGIILQMFAEATPPTPITNLSVDSAGTSIIKLKWSNPVTNWLRVELWQNTAYYPAKPADAGSNLIYQGIDSAASDTLVVPNRRYYYSAFTFNADGDTSTVTAGSRTFADTYPVAVTNFTTVVLGTSAIECSWSNPDSGAFDSIKVIRRSNGFATGITDTAAVLVYAGTDTSFIDDGLTQGTPYYYVAFTTGFSGLFSGGQEGTKSKARTTTIKPDMITGFTATALGPTRVALAWQNPTRNWTRTEIWASSLHYPTRPDIAVGTRIYSGTDTSATDTTVQPDRQYYYSAFSYNSFDEHSALGDGSSDSTITFPAPVTNFVARATNSNTIECNWTNPDSGDFDSVVVIRRIDNFHKNLNDTTGTIVHAGKEMNFTDKNLRPDTSYYYAAFTIGFSGLWQIPAADAIDTARTPRATGTPEPISGLKAVGAGPYSINLTWQNPEINYAGTRVVRNNRGFPANPADGLTIFQDWGTNCTDTGLRPDTTYFYSAFAFNSDSAFSGFGTSSRIMAQTLKPNPPNAIINFNAEPISHSSIRLSWSVQNLVDYAGTILIRRYDRFPMSVTDGTFVYRGMGFMYDDENLHPYTTYYYSAFAYNKYNEYSPAAASAQDSASTLDPPFAPGKIRHFVVKAIGSDKIKLTWENPTEDSLYDKTKIRRKTNSYPTNPSDGWSVYDNNGTSDIDSGLEPGTLYYYAAFAISNKLQWSRPTIARAITWEQNFTWNTRHYASAPLNTVFFYNSNFGWTVGQNGVLDYTNDGGGHWTSVVLDHPYKLENIFFYDLNSGWAVGSYNSKAVILSTTNGGGIWRAVNLDFTNDLSSIRFVNNKIGWAAGNKGKISKTIDGGNTWNELNTTSSTTLTACHFMNSLIGYIVGMEGSIFKTVDGGSSWTQLNSGVTQPLRQVKFLDANYGWAVGDNSTMIFTTDGGQTWNVSTPGDLFDIRDVHFINQNAGFVLTHSDKILKTRNGGKTWTVEDAGSGNTFTSFSFVNNETGFVSTQDGTILQINFALNPPGNVDDLVARQVDTNRVTLSWTNPSDGDFAGTVVMRKVSGYPVNVNDGTEVYAGSDACFTDTNLQSGTTYYYTAFAFNKKEVFSNAGTGSRASITISDYTGPYGYQVNLAGIDASRFPDISAFITVIDTGLNQIVTELNQLNFKVYENGDSMTFTVSRVDQASSAKMDLVFVVDATASMAAVVNTLALKIPGLQTSLTAVGMDCQYALIAFDDTLGEMHHFTRDAMELRTWLHGLKLVSNNNKPVNALEALARAAALPFRDNAMRTIMLVTDNDFFEWGTAGGGTTLYSTTSLITLLQNQAITTYVFAPNLERYRKIATSTGGKYYNIMTNFASSFDDNMNVFQNTVITRYRCVQTGLVNSWHHLKVTVTRNNKGGISRSKYYIGQTTLSLAPVQFLAIKGLVFTMDLNIYGVQDLNKALFTIKYNPLELELIPTGVIEGDFLKTDSTLTTFSKNIVNSTITLNIERSGGSGMSGSGVLARLKFKLINDQLSNPVYISAYNLYNHLGATLPASISSTTIHSHAPGHLLADLDEDLDIDTRDFAIFGSYWKPTNDARGDLGPAPGSAPFLTPAPDGLVNFEDLFVFARMWNWFHATFDNSGLGKNRNAIAEIMLKPHKAETETATRQFELNVENIHDLTMAHVIISYNPGVYCLANAWAGPALQSDSGQVAFLVEEDLAAGLIEISSAQLLNNGSTGFSGNGCLAVIELLQKDRNDQTWPVILEATLRDGLNRDLAIVIDTQGATSLLPSRTYLYGNYPNPFNAETKINFDLASPGQVDLHIYNLLGQRIRTLLRKPLVAGRYHFVWDSRDDAGNTLASGIYLYQLKTADFMQVRRMILIK